MAWGAVTTESKTTRLGERAATRKTGFLGRQLRCLSPEESDRLWVWICGSTEGGGFIRGDRSAVAKALKLSPKSLQRILDGPAPLLRVDTIRRVTRRLDELERAEADEGPRLSWLSWSEADDTARDARGVWYARYRRGGEWAYLTGTGKGYGSAAEARFAAFKMRVVTALGCAAE
jgi:hypothetical protein